MKKQKEDSHEGITWSEMGKQNVQAEKVYWVSTRYIVVLCRGRLLRKAGELQRNKSLLCG